MDRLHQIESGRLDPEVKKMMTCGALGPTLFFGHASVMLASGVPLMNVLEVLSGQAEDGRFAEVSWDIAQSLSEGREFSRALADFPRIFPRALLALVAAGEKSGLLVETMELASHWLEQKRDLRARLITAVTYPVLVVLFALVGSACICIFLLPQLLGAMASVGGTMHWTTKTLVNFSSIASNPSAWLVLLALVGIIYVRVSVYLETDRGKLKLAQFLRIIPLIGELFRALGLTRFLLTLGATIGVGLPIVKALRLSLQASGDAVLELQGKQMIEQIKAGEGLAQSMELYPDSFPRVLVGLLLVGEESGQIVEIIPTIATIFEERAKNLLDAMVVALEPILLGALAGVVAFCAVGFLMPLQGLLASLS